jgi:phosphatidate cytidylyltransferase
MIDVIARRIPSGPLLYILLGVLGLLVIAEVVGLLLTHTKPQSDFRELRARVRSWWLMAGVFILAILVSRLVSLVFLGFLSFLALKEYFSLIPTRRVDRGVLFWAYLAVPLQYTWVGIDWYGMFIIFIPVYMLILIPIRMVLYGQTEGFLKATGTIHWGLMTTVFTLSHMAYLLVLPGKGTGTYGAGLVLFLVLVTQLNDVAQYTWGKIFGKHKVVPTVSPNKTYEGLIGGMATTFVLVTTVLAPYLTPLTFKESLAAGFFLPLAGFLGDVSVSAVKRDIGVKDSGSLIPGHGGVLDRVNSLTFTAPLFFHFLRYLHY